MDQKQTLHYYNGLWFFFLNWVKPKQYSARFIQRDIC